MHRLFGPEPFEDAMQLRLGTARGGTVGKRGEESAAAFTRSNFAAGIG
jgi:hypothetical protein